MPTPRCTFESQCHTTAPVVALRRRADRGHQWRLSALRLPTACRWTRIALYIAGPRTPPLVSSRSACHRTSRKVREGPIVLKNSPERRQPKFRCCRSRRRIDHRWPRNSIWSDPRRVTAKRCGPPRPRLKRASMTRKNLVSAPKQSFSTQSAMSRHTCFSVDWE